MGLSDFSSIPLDSGRLNAAIGAAFWFVLALAVVGAAFATKGGKPKAGFARACSSAFPYLFSSLLACAAGVFMMYRLNCSVPGIGTNYEIYTVFAIALSGSVLGERRFNLPGVLLGSLLAAVMSNVFSLMNVPIHAQIISLGAVILAWFCLNWLISSVMFPRRGEASIG
jgi:ribose transport system permease protein